MYELSPYCFIFRTWLFKHSRPKNFFYNEYNPWLNDFFITKLKSWSILQCLEVSWSILKYLEFVINQGLKCVNFPRTDSYLIVLTFKTLQTFFYNEHVPKITEIFGTNVNQTLLHNHLKNVPKTSCTYPKYIHKSLNIMNMFRAFPAQFMFNMSKDL